MTASGPCAAASSVLCCTGGWLRPAGCDRPNTVDLLAGCLQHAAHCVLPAAGCRTPTIHNHLFARVSATLRRLGDSINPTEFLVWRFARTVDRMMRSFSPPDINKSIKIPALGEGGDLKSIYRVDNDSLTNCRPDDCFLNATYLLSVECNHSNR